MDSPDPPWYFPDMPARYLPTTPPRLYAIGRSLHHRSHRDRVLDRWVLGFILGGRLALRVGDAEVLVQPGDWYLLPPRIRHQGTASDRHDVAWVEFHAPGGPSRSERALPCSGSLAAGLDPVPVHALLQHASLAGSLHPEQATAQIQAWIGQLQLSEQRGGVGDPEHDLALRVLAWLQARVELPLRRSDLGAAFHYSPAHLNRVFRRCFGSSILRRFTELRMRHARDLLRDGLPPKAVADRLGFRDLSYFHRSFKRVLGCTPGSVAAASD